MITARPKKPLSSRMDLTLDGDPIGQLRVRFLWGEGLLECEGVRYAIRHKGFFNTLLEAVDPDSGEIFATVRSQGFVPTNQLLESEDWVLELKTRWYGRVTRVFDGMEQIGELCPTGFLTRGREARLPEEIPTRLQCLALYATILLHMKRNSQ